MTDQARQGPGGGGDDELPESVDRYRDADGVVRADLWRIGIDELNTIDTAPVLAWQPAGPSPLNNSGGAAYFQGFAPVGGQVTAIAIDPSLAADTTIYAATNNGGIWKSSDGGATWTATSDGMPSLAMGALAIDPARPGVPGVLYAGSGNLFGGGGSFPKAGGLYKSVDDGRTWFVADGGVFATTFTGDANTPTIGINRIVVTAPDALLVGTSSGLFRSIDGALNFGANAPAFDDGKPVIGGFVTALAMDTATPGRAWVAIRGLDDNLDPFPGGGLFQLTLNADGSVTPSGNLLTNPIGLAGVRFGSIAFAQSTQFPPGAANNSFLYAAVQDSPKGVGAKPVFVGLYRSTDLGAHWTPLGNLKTGVQAATAGTSREDDQTDYDLTLGVDPQDANRVYAGFKSIWSSQNGTTGATFSICSLGQVHWDQHAMVFSPASHWGAGGPPTTVYVGSDGGVARSTDGGNNWSQLNAGMNSHLFFGIDIGRGAGRNQATFGGMQDNGTAGHRATDAGTTWVAGIDGDGAVTVVDPADPTIVYGFDDQFFMKSSSGGNSWALSDVRDSVSITNATNAAPIQITAPGHLFQDRQEVTIAGVQGNTAANGKYTVVVVDPDNFHLVGTSGKNSPAYVPLTGNASGVRMGRGLANGDGYRAVALVPNGNAAATTVYVAENQDLRRSTDGGANFAPDVVKHFDYSVFALVCPDRNRIWVGTGDAKVHFSGDAGGSWKEFEPGGPGPVTGIAVDPADITRVAVVYAGFSGVDRDFQTRHCFLTTNEGAQWTDISGTEGAAVKNLPDLPLHSVAFDNSATPSTIIVASDAAVMQSADNGASWTRLGAGLPRVTCRSLAIDTSDASRTPRLLRLGTYGRSCFELARLAGPRLVVEANLAFGPVLQGKTPLLWGLMSNVGDAQVTFTSFARTAGDADFDFDIAPDLSPLGPGQDRAFLVKFAAAGSGIRTAIFTLQTNDGAHPTIEVPASGITFASGKPRLAVKAHFEFGEVERGATRSIRFYVANHGLADLTFSAFALTSNGEFRLGAPSPPPPLTAGEEQHFDLIYAPNSWGGNSSTQLHIASNDPRRTTLDIPAVGSAPRNWLLIIGLVVLGAAVVAGGAVLLEKEL
jgi:hypothetical protein